MSREIRRVPPDWQHPVSGKNWRGEPCYVGLMDNYSKRLAEWEAERAAWDRGEIRDYTKYPDMVFKPRDPAERMTFEEWNGDRPEPHEYMPEWPAEVATHIMLYETTSEGTPLTPAFATPEELARYAADNNVSAFGNSTATYEHWLSLAKRGWAPSAILSSRGFQSGVSALAQDEEANKTTPVRLVKLT